MYKFIKEEDSRADQLYIRLEYMSGDADAYDYEEYPLGDIKFSNYKDHLDKIDELVKEYKLIQKLTDINDSLNVSNPRYNKVESIKDEYEYVKEKYSKHIADLYDNVPVDSTQDGQFKAHLSAITLIGYDDKCNKYIAYV